MKKQFKWLFTVGATTLMGLSLSAVRGNADQTSVSNNSNQTTQQVTALDSSLFQANESQETANGRFTAEDVNDSSTSSSSGASLFVPKPSNDEDIQVSVPNTTAPANTDIFKTEVDATSAPSSSTTVDSGSPSGAGVVFGGDSQPAETASATSASGSSVAFGGTTSDTPESEKSIGATNATADSNLNQQAASALNALLNPIIKQSVAAQQSASTSTPTISVIQQKGAKASADKTVSSLQSGIIPSDAASKSSTKLVGLDSFSNIFYKQVIKGQKKTGKLTTVNGNKTITTPVKRVSYQVSNSFGSLFAGTTPFIIAVVAIGLLCLAFIVFDPLKYIFNRNN